MRKDIKRILYGSGLSVLMTAMMLGTCSCGKAEKEEKEPETVIVKEVVTEVVTEIVTTEVEKIIEKEVVISGQTIASGMERIGELATYEYYYTHVESFNEHSEYKNFVIPYTETSFIYSYDGVIKAGIDFTKISVDKDDKKKTLTVTLPKAEILSNDIDENSFTLYDEKTSVFNPLSVSDVASSFQDMKQSEEKKAIEKGILKKAEENAERVVENFMRGSYNIDDYKITVTFEGEGK